MKHSNHALGASLRPYKDFMSFADMLGLWRVNESLIMVVAYRLPQIVNRAKMYSWHLVVSIPSWIERLLTV